MRVWMWRIAIVMLAAGGSSAVVLAGQGDGNEGASLENPVPATEESIAEGEQLYNRRCAACHGLDAAGGPPKEDFTPPASNLIDDEWDHGSSDGEIFWVIQNGIPPELLMEPWGDRLDETEIWHVVNYIRHLAEQE